ncbi:energy transducer TonB [Flavobacterium sp. HJSW_4]|uniref:energy transducer TonB n=1 Tax=Flavobacterium sp. HJSW_4 TaxID=3344660 RepID=UPI0035F49672
MKKFILIILICFAQNTFSQSTKKNSTTKNTQTKKTETPTIQINSDYYDTESRSSQAVVSQGDDFVYNTAGVEVKPVYTGGMEKFYQFVDNNFKSPTGEDIDLKGEKIYVSFIVEKDGSLSDIKILRDAGYGTGAEAIRVIKKGNKWIPGQQNGKNVRVIYAVPITIK